MPTLREKTLELRLADLERVVELIEARLLRDQGAERGGVLDGEERPVDDEMGVSLEALTLVVREVEWILVELSLRIAELRSLPLVGSG
jgi:hypothetical protein